MFQTRLAISLKKRTPPQVSINTHITSGAAQTLSFPVRYVLFRLRITILLGHTKVNNVDSCAVLCLGTDSFDRLKRLTIGSFGTRTTDEEVVGFDITVNKVLFVDGLHSG